MIRLKNKLLPGFFSFLILIFLASCSTAPKNPEEINLLKFQAEDGIEAANKEAAKGNFEIALSLLTGFRRNAILTDDSSLIIRTNLARGNILFSMNRIAEAYGDWEQALKEAHHYGNPELLAVSKIFKARGDLISGRASARSVLDEVTKESANIKEGRAYIAFSWQVIALANSSLGFFDEAEKSVRNSLAIHEKDKVLENASYDWYIIASIRSLAGNYDSSLQAIEASIALDRRIENSWGIASSYRAMGDILRKAGRNDEAKEAYERAKAIYSAMGNEQEVAQINKRLMLD